MTQQKLLLEITRRIAASTGLEETIPYLLNGMCQVSGAASGRLWLVDDQSFAVGNATAALDELLYRAVNGQGNSHLVDVANPPGDIDLSAVQGKFSHILALPLYAQREHVGLLWLGFTGEPAAETFDNDLMEILVGQTEIALVNARAYETIHASRAQIAAILASIADVVILVDEALLVQSFNPAAEKLFDLSAAQVVGKPITDLLAHEVLAQHFQEAEAKSAPFYLDVAGRNFQAMVTDVQTEGSHDKVGRLLVMVDVSHFRRLNENMTMFLQTVSHDLRSPLTAAKGFVDMLPMVGDLNDKQSMMKEKILTSIIDMTNLVEKVLDAGRLDPEMGAYELRREPTEPAKVVDKVVSTMQAAAQKKNISIYAEVGQGVPLLSLDEMMVERALVNLVENAVKYTPAGGSIWVSANVENNKLLLAVRDNGYGIPADKQATLFDKGSRIRREEHKSIRGSGLGLFIVKNVAQQHGGDAVIESQEGQGSTFKLVIPIAGPNVIGAGQS